MNLAQGAIHNNYEFTVIDTFMAAIGARVDFFVQEGASEVLELTSPDNVVTDANGKATISFKATGAVGTQSTIWALATVGNDQVWGKVTVTIVAP